jgi:hypothetical protein
VLVLPRKRVCNRSETHALRASATRCFGECRRTSTTPRCSRLRRGRPLGQIPPPHEREMEWKREGIDLPGPVACRRCSVADYLRRRRRPVHISSGRTRVSPLEEAAMDEERGAAKTEEAGAEVATKDASGRRLCSGGCDDLKFDNKFEVPVMYSTAIPGPMLRYT